ncbi:MAG: Gfo/Idh/MocA family oxidoreductase [Cellulosilyticaceae bacterium]
MGYRLAIIGYGGMGEWHHKNISERVVGIEVVGAYDIRQDMGEKAEDNGIKRYGSLEELLCDETVDIVTIATPNNFHKDLACRCMRANKNVVCEKPVAMNAKELEEIITVRRETGKLFSVHQNRRWDKDYVIIKKILENNIIGEPYYIETRVQGSRRAMHGWRGHQVNGGGMVLDWGVHLIDQILTMVSSPVKEISAHLFSIFCEEVDDNFKMSIRFENNLSVLIEVATNCFINQPRWHMCCKEGTAVIENWNCEGKIVKLQTDEQMAWDDEIVYTEAGPTRTMAPRPKQTTEEIALPEVESNWTDYYQNIVGVLDGKEELIVKPEQALRGMQVVDAVFESAKTGQTVKCHI